MKKFASWWSHSINRGYIINLRNHLPAKLYIYIHGSIEHLLIFEEFETSKEVMKSPWPEYTRKDWRNKYRRGLTNDLQFRTWFLIIDYYDLENTLTLDDFRKYITNEEIKPQAMKSNFVYAEKTR